LNNRQNIFIPVLIIVFLLLAAVIGVGAFWLGQGGRDSETARTFEPTAIVIATPTPFLTSTAPPPVIITNTPTLTPFPTVTPGPTQTPTPTPTDTPTPTPTPIVVITHMNSLGRLETTEFAMRTVVDLENDPSNLWQQVFGSDKLMLLAEGEVVAGFDFTKIKPEDIIVNGTSVRIILPAPEILYSRIDNEKTQVYERQTGLFVKPDLSLEGRARQVAEESMVEWALERDIFDSAEKDGRAQIDNLLRSLGFTDINIEVSEPDL
jgi:hypothetical protein